MKHFRIRLAGKGLRIFMRFASVSLLLTVLLDVAGGSVFAQGLTARKLNLFPKKPPIVFPGGATFTVQVYQQGLFDPQLTQRIKDELELVLPRYDWRLKATPSAPDTVISFIVTELTAFSTRQTDTTVEHGVIGTHSESDPSTGTTVNVPEYGAVPRHISIAVLEGHLTVRYEAREAATARRLDSDLLTIDFKQGYERRAPTTSDVYQMMIDNLVHMVAARFVPDFHPVRAPLPAGRFKHASILLHHGRWNSAIDAIHAVPELPAQEDEAYRLYAFGLAHEGLAYEAPYLLPTINYLKQAAAYYKLAKLRKTTEAAFHESETRVLDLLTAYRKVEPSVRAFEEGKRRKDAESLILSKFQSRYKSTNFLDNTDVLGWAQSDAKEKEMLDRLRGERDSYFDLTPDGIAALQSAGVSSRVIDAMRESMRGRPYHDLGRRKWLDKNSTLLSVYPHLIIRKSSE